MTVTYTSEVTNSKGFGCFLKLLLRWRGSIYKIMWAELIAYLILYYMLKLIYEVILYTHAQRSYFASIVKYCKNYESTIPLSFVLGFYVSLITTRWWGQYTSIPFPDNLAILVGASVEGKDDSARMVRRTIVRYACLSFSITLTMMSPKVKRRFPTRDHLIEAGLLSEDEKRIMDQLDNEFPGYSKYWLPLAWASNLVTRSRHEGFIRDDESVKTLLEELNLFRSKCGGMLDYDWISVPLVYTQVVTIAVYSYFAFALLGTQFIEGDFQIHAYFPLLSVLQFFFYMGWLKVAESLINPFGDDDDDFEVAWMIDRHLQVCYLLVDKIHQEHPKLIKDNYWSKRAPQQLPYTIASIKSMQEAPVESTSNITVKMSDQDIIIPHDNEVDGEAVPGTALQRLFGKNIRNRHKIQQIPLKMVSFDRQKTEDCDTTEVHDYATDHLANISKTEYINDLRGSSNDEFERLRRKRKEDHVKKLINNIMLLNEKNSEKRIQMIRQLVDK